MLRNVCHILPYFFQNYALTIYIYRLLLFLIIYENYDCKEADINSTRYCF